MSSFCTQHAAFFSDRGGDNIFAPADQMTLVRWNRVRDEISDAVIRIAVGGAKCASILGDLRTGRHELIIKRNGKDAWQGPITRLGYHSRYVEIEARDVLQYAYRKGIRNAYNNAHPNVEFTTRRTENIMRTEMADLETNSPRPINFLPYLDIRTTNQTAKTSRSTLPYQLSVYEDIDYLAARSGLDYTVLGRSLIVSDVHDTLDRTRVLTEADFIGDELIVTEYGMELATTTIATDGQGRAATSSLRDLDLLAYYGPHWEILNTSYDVTKDNATSTEPPTLQELASQASRDAAGRAPAPVVVRVPDGSAMHPATVAELYDQLFPGVRIPIRATMTARSAEQEQKLDKIRFEETPRGETVGVTMSPAPGAVGGVFDDGQVE